MHSSLITAGHSSLPTKGVSFWLLRSKSAIPIESEQDIVARDLKNSDSQCQWFHGSNSFSPGDGVGLVSPLHTGGAKALI